MTSTTPRSAWPARATGSPAGSATPPTRSSARRGKWDADAVYKPFAIPGDGRWRLWYNGRRGGVEQIGMAIHEGDDLGFPKP